MSAYSIPSTPEFGSAYTENVLRKLIVFLRISFVFFKIALENKVDFPAFFFRENGRTGTDAEACAYLMTVSLTQPIDSDWTQIYLYVAGKVYERHRTKESGVTMPEDIRVDKLSDYQMQHLNRLKDWIYGRRIRARVEKDRAERKGKKEEQETKQKEERPALFEF
jgi:hypothetical protein